MVYGDAIAEDLMEGQRLDEVTGVWPRVPDTGDDNTHTYKIAYHDTPRYAHPDTGACIAACPSFTNDDGATFAAQYYAMPGP